MPAERLTIPTAPDATCAAVYHQGLGEQFLGPSGRPCIILGHGFAATRDCGLDGFAEAYAEAGIDVIAFDYRSFGESRATSRQIFSPKEQLEDYRGVTAFARGLPSVDADRVVLWGASFAGGHVLQLAGETPDLAAVIALTPAPDGLAAAMETLRQSSPPALTRTLLAGLRDLVAAGRGRERVMIPVVGRSGSSAILQGDGVADGYRAIAGPTWRNEVAASAALAAMTHRPIRHVRAGVPTLVQVADDDRTAAPRLAMKAAWKARADVRHYPCDHFDVYPGRPLFDRVLAHQLHFLRRHLGHQVSSPADTETLASTS